RAAHGGRDRSTRRDGGIIGPTLPSRGTTMSPRSFAMALLVLIALLLGAVGATPAQPGPIKIGFITDLTGPAAQAAKDMVNGITMYLDEIGSQMAGRKVELIVEDSQGRPDAA